MTIVVNLPFTLHSVQSEIVRVGRLPKKVSRIMEAVCAVVARIHVYGNRSKVFTKCKL